MAKKSKKSAVDELRNGISALTWLGVTAVSIEQFGIDITSIESSVKTFGPGVLAAAGVYFIITLLFDRKPKVEMTFDFDEAPPTRHKAATQFEYDVAGLINAMTGKRTQVVGGKGDGGIDIKVYDEKNSLVGVVQCKNVSQNKTVPPAYIRDLNSARHYHHVNIAYLVTTGRFSDQSHELARKLGVKLIDGQALKRMRAKYLPQATQSHVVSRL